MPLILSVKNKYPRFGKDNFIAENATVVGDVILGDHCSVWFNAVIRGDVNHIRIGNNTNVQDGAIIHCTYLRAATEIGNNVSIGHLAVVHGCTVRDNVLIGMRAVVMDHAVIEPYCIIAAGSVVLENTICESGHIYAGSPAKKIKPVTPEQRELLDRLPNNYILYSGWFMDSEEEEL
ncbi:gamma carbonic anhydrase family protein (plasmid) [Pedobacter sp. BS3]|uniref:gamma carbonic anhydrase family protein n=1 Tax=Pedobacter sp. BS3 TaxID=2567937 RepID=UPI0011EE23E0|nr:gamma carbonic anhydrase family protein [Pedobacter sp. BS3]TZF85777.1 gamma carbonic anhydrase family protein [Pedobacter sp. BS3]